MSEVARQAKGWKRRLAIIDAAAAILLEGGPVAVTHRTVAARAGCSLSATTYYFTGIEELLAEAGALNMNRWALRAERVAHEISAEPHPESLEDSVNLLLRASLPAVDSLENHYLQLVAASAAPAVFRAYREGRARLDAALQTVLDRIDLATPPQLITAVVDGAAVAALSEGRDIRETARALLTSALLQAEERYGRAAGATFPDAGEAGGATDEREVADPILTRERGK